MFSKILGLVLQIRFLYPYFKYIIVRISIKNSLSLLVCVLLNALNIMQDFASRGPMTSICQHLSPYTTHWFWAWCQLGLFYTLVKLCCKLFRHHLNPPVEWYVAKSNQHICSNKCLTFRRLFPCMQAVIGSGWYTLMKRFVLALLLYISAAQKVPFRFMLEALRLR